MKTLLLWDIDGTLIDSGGAGERALRASLQDAYGIIDALGWLELAGRTDLWIARQILERHEKPVDDDAVKRLLAHYLKALPTLLSNPKARTLPGVTEALRTASARPAVAQGLLTGNVAAGAQIKLEYFNLWSYFAFGAFADDSAQRNELGPFAVRRAAAHHGFSFNADQVIVIGDTPHDIACGQTIGARTFGVATGRFSEADLKTAGADVVLKDLVDAELFWRAVEKAS